MTHVEFIKIMISKVEDKAISFLETILDFIQMYSKDMNLKSIRKQEELENKKETTVDFKTRLELIKDDYSTVFARGIMKTCELVKEYKLLNSIENYYKYASLECLNLCDNIVGYLKPAYALFDSHLIIPLKDNIVFVCNLTTYNVSIICNKISESQILHYLSQKFDQVKITVGNGWSKIDLTFDNKVNVKDLYRRMITYMRNDLNNYKRKELELSNKRSKKLRLF